MIFLIETAKTAAVVVDTGRVLRRLAAFGQSVVNKKVRPALRAGMKPMLAKVKQLTPVLARDNRSRGRKRRIVLRPRPRKSPRPVRGLLKRSFGLRAVKRKKGRIGLILITGKLYKAAWYGWFVERGTHMLSAGIKRKHRAGFARQHGQQRIRPRRFIRKGFDQTQLLTRRIILVKLRQGLHEAAAEARRVA